jgi:hypothetical protein
MAMSKQARDMCIVTWCLPPNNAQKVPMCRSRNAESLVDAVMIFPCAVVPPGYRQAGNTIVPCKTGADGEYKAGWDRATSCKPCGKAVYSDTTEWITVFNDDGTTSPLDVAGSSHSCCKFGVLRLGQNSVWML